MDFTGEIKTAFAGFRQASNELENIHFGADVDAFCRLIKKIDGRIE